MINCFICKHKLIKQPGLFLQTTEYSCNSHHQLIFVKDNMIEGFDMFALYFTFVLCVKRKKFFFNGQNIDLGIKNFPIESFNEKILSIVNNMEKYFILQ